MNCNNPNCQKEIRNYYTCSKCGKNFCTNSCVTNHTLEHHSSQSRPQGRGQPQRMSGIRSLFMKMGKFAKEIIDDSYYSFQNFEYVKNKTGKKFENLGSGAFGEVFLSKHKKDGKLFAIKQMEKEKIIETGATLDLLYREISIHRRLNHENIVKLHSHYEDSNNLYLVMDYSNSGTLFNVIKKNKGIDEKRAFKYFIQAVAAVHFLHENNLVHRDLKPENMLLDENDNVRLCDFGWCVDISAGNRITFCGTYEYMAPEIIKEMPYDYSIDVWSLGILLYELIHGYSPFRAQNGEDTDEYAEIFKNIIKYNFKIEKDISKNCKDIITKLLIPDNKNRIRTKDIFFHPWVLEFEKEYKKEKIEKMQREESEKNKQNENKNKIVDLLNEEISLKNNYNSNTNSNANNLSNIVDTSINATEKIKVSEKINFYESNLNSKNNKKSSKINNNKDKGFSLLEGFSYNSNKNENIEKIVIKASKDNKDNINDDNKNEDNKNDNINKTDDYDNVKKEIKTNPINSTNPIKPTIPSNNTNCNNNSLNKDSKAIIDKYTKDIKENILNTSKQFKENYDSKNLYSEFSILNNQNDYNLFDKVLNQVSKKNGGKKKKSNSISKNVQKEILNISKSKEQPTRVNTENAISNSNLNIQEKTNDKFFLDEEFNTNEILGIYDSNINIARKKTSISNSNCDDILDEEYAQHKKKELSKFQITKDFLEEDNVEIYKKDNKNNNDNYNNNNRYNEFNLINEEEFKYPLNNKNKNKAEKSSSYTHENNKNVDSQAKKSPYNKKDLDKELDLSFLPKYLLYNDSNYQDSNKNLLYAIEVLEKAQSLKEKHVVVENNPETFWTKVGSFFNPFKCGKDGNN